MDKYYKYIIPTLIIAIFLFISAVYTSPVFTGKVLRSNDIVQSQGGAKELKDFEEKSGRRALWTNSMFSGMPAYMVYVDYPNSWTTKIGRFFTYQLGIPNSTNVIFLLLVCFYIFLLMLGKNHWVSALGAIGFAFASYNLISIEAGHLAKLFAIAYAPPLIGSVIMAYRGKLITGAALAALFTSLQLYANHVQITYYTLIALLVYGIVAFVGAIQQQKLPQFAKATGLLLVAGGLAVGSQATRLLINYEYSKQTIRGKSELKSNKQSGGGLDRDYAFQWSSGIQESFSFLIPNYYGGASGQAPEKKSKTLAAIQNLASNPQLQKNPAISNDLNNIFRKATSYWGGLPFTSGPSYFGVSIILLFIFSFFLTKNPLKWYLLGMTLLFLVISWGKNFPAFNYFLFDYAPLYNKFRAVTMALHIINIFMIWMIALGLQELFNAEIKLKSLIKPLMISAGATVGVILLALLMVDLNMQPIRDILAKYPDYIKSDIINAIKSDRSGMVRADAFRSVIFTLLIAASLWVWFTGRLKREYAFVLLIGITLVDLWVIDKRYFNNENFVKQSQLNQISQPTAADQFILNNSKDDPHYRVLNVAKGFSQDATTSFFHKSLGGYHGAKLRRYNELIDQHFYRNINGAYRNIQAGNVLGKANTNDSTNFSVLNMLNMKYMIVQGNNNQEVVLKNTQNLGNAWFVDSYKVVKDSDEEIASLKIFDPKKVAFVNPRYKDEVSKIKISPDPSATIKLTKYEPDYLAYESNAKGQQLAVFSEVYYNNGLGWDAYIDGKKVPHFRVNYVLRALAVPGGKHKIEFKFKPKTYYKGESISLIASILIILLFLAAAGLAYKNSRPQKEV
ncbi:hypothetical protein BKI52_26395 [marine bacterium AO1-C]|nr:hypothetical protein BKI52_26395 [marine bacterium AO1-C]